MIANVVSGVRKPTGFWHEFDGEPSSAADRRSVVGPGQEFLQVFRKTLAPNPSPHFVLCVPPKRFAVLLFKFILPLIRQGEHHFHCAFLYLHSDVAVVVESE